MSERRGDLDRSRAVRRQRRPWGCPEELTDVKPQALRKPHRHTRQARLRYRPNQQSLPKHEALLLSIPKAVAGKLVPERPHDRCSATMGLLEERVEVREQGVPALQRKAHTLCVLRLEQPRLAPRRIRVRMRPAEWRVNSRLVPTDEQLRLRIAKEPPNIGADKRDPREGQRKQHRCHELEVRPGRHAVTRPDRNVPLRAREERTAEDEGALARSRSKLPLERRLCHEVTVHIVGLAVLE